MMSSRYNIVMALVATGLTILPYTVQANFTVVKNNSQPVPQTRADPSPPITMVPLVDPGDLAQAESRTKSVNQTSTVHWIVASGFGNNVPLGFACKQIVPPAVKVTYGPGASAKALVTWKGGTGWNKVLLAAVKPLGLKLVMTHMAVEIRK